VSAEGVTAVLVRDDDLLAVGDGHPGDAGLTVVEVAIVVTVLENGAGDGRARRVDGVGQRAGQGDGQHHRAQAGGGAVQHLVPLADPGRSVGGRVRIRRWE